MFNPEIDRHIVFSKRFGTYVGAGGTTQKNKQRAHVFGWGPRSRTQLKWYINRWDDYDVIPVILTDSDAEEVAKYA